LITVGLVAEAGDAMMALARAKATIAAVMILTAAVVMAALPHFVGCSKLFT
jgi:hypothetical protein